MGERRRKPERSEAEMTAPEGRKNGSLASGNSTYKAAGKCEGCRRQPPTKFRFAGWEGLPEEYRRDENRMCRGWIWKDLKAMLITWTQCRRWEPLFAVKLRSDMARVPFRELRLGARGKVT